MSSICNARCECQLLYGDSFSMKSSTFSESRYVLFFGCQMSKRKHSNGVLDGVDFQLIVVDLIVCDYSQMNFVEKEVEKAFVADSFIDYLPLPPITKILMNVI